MPCPPLSWRRDGLHSRALADVIRVVGDHLFPQIDNRADALVGNSIVDILAFLTRRNVPTPSETGELVGDLALRHLQECHEFSDVVLALHQILDNGEASWI